MGERRKCRVRECGKALIRRADVDTAGANFDPKRHATAHCDSPTCDRCRPCYNMKLAECGVVAKPPT